MRWWPRRPETGASGRDWQEAHDWNRWASHQTQMWAAVDEIPAGHPARDTLRRRAVRLNDAMWQLDPAMWVAVTSGWPDRWRTRRLR